ncbi:Gypsy retrotransposon integrase-like protein 1 [Trichinella pseudospiralis]|uniref:RNA-directed DNA polymerase n=1 Tax=Trichinella pseudospiralis TaxID=6337 RepID=A0A0V1FMK0_TRIPS|nr:Gypsy retrotransposon integrase-like protein 1 [Trichinella pseudospiralis]
MRSCLLASLTPNAFEELRRSCLPTTPYDFTYDECVGKMKELYGRRVILMRERANFFRITQSDNQTPKQFANILREAAGHCNFESFNTEAQVLRSQRNEGLKPEAFRMYVTAVEKQDILQKNASSNALSASSVGGKAIWQKCKQRLQNSWKDHKLYADGIYAITERAHNFEVTVKINGKSTRMELDTGAAVTIVTPECWKRERRLLAMTELEAGHTPSVVGKLNGLEVPLFLDSGAVVSVVPLSTWQKSTGGEPLEAARGSILFGDGRRVRICGQGVLPLQVGGWRGRIHFAVVESLVVPGILGTNFLDQCIKLIDWQARKMTMTDGSKVRIQHDPSWGGQPSIGCAVVAKPQSVRSDVGAGVDWSEDWTRALVDGAECSGRSKRVLRSILRKCGKAISRGETDFGRTSLVKHCIETGGAQPVKLPPRDLPQAQRAVAGRLTREMLHAGVIEPASAPWSSPGDAGPSLGYSPLPAILVCGCGIFVSRRGPLAGQVGRVRFRGYPSSREETPERGCAVPACFQIVRVRQSRRTLAEGRRRVYAGSGVGREGDIATTDSRGQSLDEESLAQTLQVVAGHFEAEHPGNPEDHPQPTNGGGHLDGAKTLAKVRQRYYWPQQREDVEDWCRACQTCAARAIPTRKLQAPMQLQPGPLVETQSGNRYILVVCDYFSKWPEAFPLPNAEALTVATALVNGVCCRYGAPETLHSDQGRNFESELVKEMCQLFGSDGLVERMNRMLLDMLVKASIDYPEDWDVYLDRVLLAYRTSVHCTTGATPSRVVFVRELRLSVDLMYGVPTDAQVRSAGEYVQHLRRDLERVYEVVRKKAGREQRCQKAWKDRKW